MSGARSTASADPEERLARVIDVYLPSSRRDQSWVLWIDVWGEALRDANLRRISEELDNAWVELVAEVIADGVGDRGRSAATTRSRRRGGCARCSTASACRSSCTTATMTRAQMHKHVHRAAALELGYELPY